MKIFKFEKRQKGKACFKSLSILGCNAYSFGRVGDVFIVRLLCFNVFKGAGAARCLLGISYVSIT